MGCNNKRKVNIPMCAALVLRLLTMISVHITSGLYARYTSTASATDSARVAKFDVSCDVQPVKNSEGVYTLTVTNHSEVAVKYSFTVRVPDAICVAVDSQAARSPAAGEDTVTFENDNWKLAPGEHAQNHTLTFAVVDWSILSSPSPNPEDSRDVTVDFDVIVTAEQLD
jgi:hypothetical protein